MGTNYYVKIKKKVGRKIVEEDIHIGKCSCGWKFLFAPNPGYYENTKLSINRFLKLHKDSFFDEYGRKIDIDEFWKEVESHQDGMDSSDYVKKYNEGWTMAAKESYSTDGLGLRIAATPDFS